MIAYCVVLPASLVVVVVVVEVVVCMLLSVQWCDVLNVKWEIVVKLVMIIDYILKQGVCGDTKTWQQNGKEVIFLVEPVRAPFSCVMADDQNIFPNIWEIIFFKAQLQRRIVVWIIIIIII